MVLECTNTSMYGSLNVLALVCDVIAFILLTVGPEGSSGLASPSLGFGDGAMAAEQALLAGTMPRMPSKASLRSIPNVGARFLLFYCLRSAIKIKYLFYSIAL